MDTVDIGDPEACGFGLGADHLAYTADEHILLADVHRAAQACADLSLDLLNYLARPQT